MWFSKVWALWFLFVSGLHLAYRTSGMLYTFVLSMAVVCTSRISGPTTFLVNTIAFQSDLQLVAR